MADQLGTRSKSQSFGGRIDQGANTRTLSTNPGMTKNVAASITFSGSTATGANGTFTGTFAVYDPVLIQSEAGSLNDGSYFTVIGLDATNAAFLTLDPPPKAEGPIEVTMRTP